MGCIVTLLKSRKEVVWGQVEKEDLITFTKDELLSNLESSGLKFTEKDSLITVLYHNCIMSFNCKDINNYLEMEIVGNNRMSVIAKIASVLKLDAYSLDGNEVNQSFDYELGEWVQSLIKRT